MKSVLLLLAVLLPSSSFAADLWRTWKNPKPEAIKLVKNFYETREVDSTCSEEKCEMVDTNCWRQECHNEDYTDQECHMEFVCRWDNEKNENDCSSWENVCHDVTKTREVCNSVSYDCREQRCWDESYSCTETKEVLVRSWKATLRTNFDAKAVPARGKDEKFVVELEGDEHEPKLSIRKVVGPFEYEITPKFSADAKTVDVDFTLAPKKP